MAMAVEMAGRGDCAKAQIGAVIVNARNQIVASGYNGPPGGLDQTCRLDCPRYLGQDYSNDYGACLTIHAEVNALLFCSRDEREGGSIYVSAASCRDCAKILANSGLARVVMIWGETDAHRDPAAVGDFLTRCGLEVVWAS